MIPVMVARDSVTAEHGISALSLMSRLLEPSSSSDRLPLASPHNSPRLTCLLATVYVGIRAPSGEGRGCHAKRVGFLQVRNGEEESWTGLWRTRGPFFFEGDHRDSGGKGASEAPGRFGWSRRVRPSGCVLHRDAHHSTVLLATATTLTARLASKESQSRPRERGERTGPQVGTKLVASGRYITCVLAAAVLNARDLPHLASRRSRRRSLHSEKRSAILSQEFLGLPTVTVRASVIIQQLKRDKLTLIRFIPD